MEQFNKNLVAPWQSKGRWYHFFIESTGSAAKLTTSDIAGTTISGTKLILPAGYHIVDQKHDYTSVEATSHTLSSGIYFDADGRQGISFVNVANFTSVDIWLFAYVGD